MQPYIFCTIFSADGTLSLMEPLVYLIINFYSKGTEWEGGNVTWSPKRLDKNLVFTYSLLFTSPVVNPNYQWQPFFFSFPFTILSQLTLFSLLDWSWCVISVGLFKVSQNLTVLGLMAESSGDPYICCVLWAELHYPVKNYAIPVEDYILPQWRLHNTS